MDTRWLEAFIAVAEELHFGRAAERLHMAQSPLSQLIRKLERQVGATLFDRTIRGVALTSAGHALLPHARRIVGDIDLAVRATQSNDSGVYGRVRIGFSGALNHLTLPSLARAVQRTHPNIELTLVDQIVTRDAVALIEHNNLDLAFVGLPLSTGSLATRTIALEPLGVVMPRSDPRADAGEIALADLTEDEFLTLPGESTLTETTVTSCALAGFRPRITQEIKDPFLVLSCAAAGIGIFLAPTCLRPVLPADAAFVPLAGTPPRLHSALLWDPARATEALQAVLAVAGEVLPEPPD